MSSHTFKKTIEGEIRKLNNEIDLKIIKGLSYGKEALRHKFLLKQLQRLNRQSGWLQKSFSLVSTFIL